MGDHPEDRLIGQSSYLSLDHWWIPLALGNGYWVTKGLVKD